MPQKKKKREKVTLDDWVVVVLMITLCISGLIGNYIEYGPAFFKNPDNALSFFYVYAVLVVCGAVLIYLIYLTIQNKKNKK